jgi:uncharacterized membrane protein
MPTNVAVHTISFRGKAGAIFVLLSSSIVLFLIAFVTHDWAFLRAPDSADWHREGLWENCTCSRLGQQDDWHHAVQGMISIGLIALLIAFLLISIYMCVHTVSKNSTIIALVCVCFIAVLFMLIGFIIYAVEKLSDHYTLSWSYAVAILSSILCLIAGVLSIVQLRSAGVRV